MRTYEVFGNWYPGAFEARNAKEAIETAKDDYEADLNLVEQEDPNEDFEMWAIAQSHVHDGDIGELRAVRV
jgi:hypothetical protein